LPRTDENTLDKLTVRTVGCGPKPLGLIQRLAGLCAPAFSAGTRHDLETIARGGYKTPRLGHARFGSLRRLTPISTVWGFDRGTPIDRCYIEQFLDANSRHIFGRVLEVDDNNYTGRFGADRVVESEILTIDAQNPRATMVADITTADSLPEDSFDCIILTQTLQLIYEFKKAVHSVRRMLKPGGHVLATVPGISPMGDGAWGEWWAWSFTPLSTRLLFGEVFGAGNVSVVSYGNVLTAAALLYGVAAEELRPYELEYHDPTYCVTIGIKAVKKT
jgi:SAM-dependent methyltransferase